jgi:hypothetical protein
MAHYAFIDENNIVTEVIVGNDETTADWESFYANVRGQRCLRTSYNTHGGVHHNGGTPYRKNFAGIGYEYRSEIDGFVPPCPGEGWVLDEATATWIRAEEQTG